MAREQGGPQVETRERYTTAAADDDERGRNGALLPVRTMDEILAELDQRGQPPTAEVPVPEWRATFRVRGLTRAEVLHISRLATHGGRLAPPGDQAVQDVETLLLGVVEPKITREHYARLRHRSDANPIINRLQTKIAELTTGERVENAAGEEVDAVDAAYFPSDGTLAPGGAVSGHGGNGSAAR